MDAIVAFLLLGGGAASVAFALAYAFARTRRQTQVLLAVGGAGLLAAALVFGATGAFETDESCGELCGLGTFIALVVLIGNAIGWTLGVAAGAATRRARSGRASTA